MPNRLIRESALTSATLYRLSDGAERFFWRLTLVADDYGRFEAEPQILKARCFPLWPDKKMSSRRVASLYGELEHAELVKTYVVGAKRYGFFATWAQYQQIRAKKSKYPEPHATNLLASICEQTPADSFEVVSGILPNTNPNPITDEESPLRGTLTASQLIDLFNDLTPDETPSVETRSPERLRKANRYVKVFPHEQFWRESFAQVHRSEFLRGLSKARNGHESFVADFDWMLSKGKDGTENIVKVHDGKYA